MDTYFKDEESKRKFIVNRNFNLKYKSNKKELKNFNFIETQASHCSDYLKIFYKKQGNKNFELKFYSESCTITNVATDLLIDIITKQNDKQDIESIIFSYLKFINENKYDQQLGHLIVFENLVKQKRRIKCLELPVSCLKKII